MIFGWLEITVGSIALVIFLMLGFRGGRSWLDPTFWRNASISSALVMTGVLLYLTFDSLKQIGVGGGRVPAYTVINQQIDYVYDSEKRHYVPKIGGTMGLMGKVWSAEEAEDLINRGKKVIQSRNCMGCHTLLGNGAYYAPDLTKAWLDPKWETMIMPLTGATTKEEAMVKWLQRPDLAPTWTRRMPNLQLSEEEARATVAYLKFMSAIDTNGFPDHFGVSAGQ